MDILLSNNHVFSVIILVLRVSLLQRNSQQATVLANVLFADTIRFLRLQGFSAAGFASLPLPETMAFEDDPGFGLELGARPSLSLGPGMDNAYIIDVCIDVCNDVYI